MTSSLVSTGVELEYETFGSPDSTALVLIAGFGAQLLSWHADLCQILADQGRYVIRFDNRDAGKSTMFDQHAVDLHASPQPPPATSTRFERRPRTPCTTWPMTSSASWMNSTFERPTSSAHPWAA